MDAETHLAKAEAKANPNPARNHVDTSRHRFTVTAMRILLALFSALLLIGCATHQPEIPNDQAPAPMFKPAAMRLHPVFSQIRDWNGDGKPDGVEAMLEFQDQFGEPVKAMGNAVFELFEYRSGYPDPRGQRLVNPYLATLDNAAAQRSHWNRAGRAYNFQLAYPDVSPKRSYVLTVSFQLADGSRFFDRIVLQPQREGNDTSRPSTPARAPGARSQQP